jgi:hypothetical protein
MLFNGIRQQYAAAIGSGWVHHSARAGGGRSGDSQYDRQKAEEGKILIALLGAVK